MITSKQSVQPARRTKNENGAKMQNILQDAEMANLTLDAELRLAIGPKSIKFHGE